jgi:heme/copper-type cytochrome/quinol oxidase subunit 3
VGRGAGLTVDRMWSTFFVLTGFHGAHVLVGLGWLLTLLVRGLRRSVEPSEVGLAMLFWLFVDAAWLPLFAALYVV